MPQADNVKVRFPLHNPDKQHAPDRRHDQRLPLIHPVKLRCLENGRCLAGRTDNLSAGGALLEIDHPSLLVPGQVVQIGIAFTGRQTVLTSADLIEARVIRSLGHRDGQSVAVGFTQRQQLPRLAASA